MPWGEDQGRSEGLKMGRCALTISKIVPKIYRTQKGDRQIAIIVSDDGGREGFMKISIEGKGQFVLRRLFQAFGLHVSDLQKQGLEPEHLLMPDVARHWLQLKTFEAEVKPGQNADYPQIDIIVPKTDAAFDDDAPPF